MIAETLSREATLTTSEQRRAIVSDILTNGLSPGTLLHKRNVSHLPSVESTRCQDVQGNLLLPSASFADIINLLYSSMSSFFPVVTERKTGMKWPETELEASERSQASFLVVCRANEVKQEATGVIQDRSDAGDGLGFPGGVPSTKFSYLVFPKPIMENVAGLVMPPNLQVIVVENAVRRFLYRRDKIPAIVPDYESVLKQLTLSTPEPLWVHIVRLPTQHD